MLDLFFHPRFRNHRVVFFVHVLVALVALPIIWREWTAPFSAVYGAQTTVTFTAANDGKINKSAATNNYGSNTTMDLGRNGSGSQTRRVLVEFDISSIPANAVINSATLKLFQSTSASGLSGVRMDLHRLTRDWTESQFTWNKSDTATDWTTAGGDYNSSETASTTPGSSGGDGTEHSLVVTSDVAAFVAGTATNYGWVLKFNNELTSNVTPTFHTSESATAAYYPQLSVMYTTPSSPTSTIVSVTQRRDGSGIFDIVATAYDAEADKVKMRVYGGNVACNLDNGQLTLGPAVTASTNDSGGAPDVNASNYYQVGSTVGTQIVATVTNTLNMTWLAGTDYPNLESSVPCFAIGVNDGTLSSTSTLASVAMDTKAPTLGTLTSPSASTSTVTFGAWGSACNTTDTNFKEYKLHYATTAGLTSTTAALASSTYSGLGSSTCSGIGGTTSFGGFLTGTTYYTNLFAYDTYGNVASSTSELTFTTDVATPGAPTVAASTTSKTSLVVVIDKGGNTGDIEYAICKSDDGSACASGGYVQEQNPVQGSSSLASSAVWQTYSEWGGASGVSVTDLTVNTAYRFLVQARRGSDGAGATSLSSANTAVYTLAGATGAATPTNATVTSTLQILLTWTDGGGASGYKIERDAGCDGTYDTTIYDNVSTLVTSPTTTAYGLSANTCYKFRLSSYNSGGVLNSYETAVSAAITTPPGQPQSVTASATQTDSITWSWSAVTNASYYDVYNSSTGALLSTVSDPTVQYSQTGLSANTPYGVVVRARNGNSTGIASTAASTYTDTSVPTGLAHSNQTASAIRWTWTNGGQSAFYVDNTTNSTNSGWITDAYWDQSSLTANTAYTISVKARSGAEEETSASSITRYTSQNTPSSLSFTPAASVLTVTADGTFVNQGVASSLIHFDNGAGTTQDVTSGASWTNSGLSVNTQYTYTAYAVNGDGDQTDSVSGSRYTLANAPGAITASADSATSISLTLDRNSNPTGTNVQITDASGLYVDTSAKTLTGTQSSFDTFSNWGVVAVTGLTPNTGYQFVSVAKNGDGVLTASSTTSTVAYTLANTPANPLVTADSQTQLTLTWGANENSDGTMYYAQNSTAGTNTGWTTGRTWTVTGLACGTTYTLKVKAKNSVDVETEYQTVTGDTSSCPSGGGSAQSQSTAAIEPPSIPLAPPTILSPQEKQVFAALPFDISGVGAAGAVVTVEIAGSSYTAVADTGGHFVMTVLDQLVPGTYTMRATQSDARGRHSVESARTVVYTPPLAVSEKDDEGAPIQQSETSAETPKTETTQETPPQEVPPKPPPVASRPPSSPTQAEVAKIVTEKTQETTSAFLFVLQSNTAAFHAAQINHIEVQTGTEVEMVVRPKQAMHSVTARLYPALPVLSRAPQPVSRIARLQQWLFPVAAAATVSTSSVPEPWVAAYVFSYVPARNLYEQAVSLPPNLSTGEYRFVLTFNGEDGSRTSVTKKMIVVGKGKITNHDGAPVPNARVTIYRKGSDSAFVIWPSGDLYGQKNPILTDALGEYTLTVPAGAYYVTVDIPTHKSFQSGVFVFDKPDIIHEEVELARKERTDPLYRFVSWTVRLFLQ